MFELYTPLFETRSRKEKKLINLLKKSQKFLEHLDINFDLLLDTITLMHRYLRKCEKIPHNLFKFLISAYYIASRHPLAFPLHESKQDFCKKFGIQISSLEYGVEKISRKLDLIKILDDMNYPYFLDPDSDLGLKFVKNTVKATVEKSMMKFLIYNKPIDSQILTERLTKMLILEEKIFPEELFRQFYEVIFEFVEKKFQDYYDYVELQQKYLI